ncbi:MAG: RNA pseudouridine synthase [Planctomycetes bacterium]|nr:RNA pseudouridine synthase [Planctomycetota bacterium]
MLALHKPSGVPVVPDESGDESLYDAAREWIGREYAKPGEVFLGVVHRLDRPVSGVVLFARTSKAAARLSEQFRAHTVRKLYFGVSASRPRETSGVLEQWLDKDGERNVVRVLERERPGAQLAVTRWRLASFEHGLAHLDLEPRTGRPHQLRVAAASLGAPLLGDLKYGAVRPLADRSVGLHAAELEVEHPTLRTPLVLRAPPPAREWWSARR